MAIDILGEIEQEQKRLAAKANGGNASFFKLKDGERALVRPLLNLGNIAVILKHDFFNPTTRKYEISALCTGTSYFGMPDQCQHCQTAKDTKNKKLLATKYFVVPLWVYSVKNAEGQTVTYTDQEGNEKQVSGLRYLQMKASSDILGVLTAMYREGIDITSLDLVIGRKGESLDTKYTVLQHPPKPFAVENVPPQSAESIIVRIADLNQPEFIEEKPATATNVSQSSMQKQAPKVSAPDF